MNAGSVAAQLETERHSVLYVACVSNLSGKLLLRTTATENFYTFPSHYSKPGTRLSPLVRLQAKVPAVCSPYVWETESQLRCCSVERT